MPQVRGSLSETSWRSARCRPREALLLGMCQHVALQFFHDQAADRRITWT
jgi:hypothetical protein